jgi:Protein of unknown function (DUF983)
MAGETVVGLSACSGAARAAREAITFSRDPTTVIPARADGASRSALKLGTFPRAGCALPARVKAPASSAQLSLRRWPGRRWWGGCDPSGHGACSAHCGHEQRNTPPRPAVFVILILGALVLGGALFVEFRFEPPVWVHVVLWGIMIPILAFAMLRILKGVLIGLQYAHKAKEGRFDKQ